MTFSNMNKMYNEVYDAITECKVIVVDEVGSDLSPKGDVHIGGAKYACKKGTVPQNKVKHTDKHFTLLGFTTLSGEPVLCLVITAGGQELLAIENGIKPFVTQTYRDASDNDYFKKNFGPGKLFPGGPTCKFLGRDIPCIVRWSPKGSITSQILSICLKGRMEKSHSSFWMGISPGSSCHSLNTSHRSTI